MLRGIGPEAADALPTLAKLSAEDAKSVIAAIRRPPPGPELDARIEALLTEDGALADSELVRIEPPAPSLGGYELTRIGLPAVPALLAFTFHAQAIVFHAGGEVAVSNGLTAVVGV